MKKRLYNSRENGSVDLSHRILKKKPKVHGISICLKGDQASARLVASCLRAIDWSNELLQPICRLLHLKTFT